MGLAHTAHKTQAKKCRSKKFQIAHSLGVMQALSAQPWPKASAPAMADLILESTIIINPSARTHPHQTLAQTDKKKLFEKSH